MTPHVFAYRIAIVAEPTGHELPRTATGKLRNLVTAGLKVTSGNIYQILISKTAKTPYDELVGQLLAQLVG